MKKTIKLLCTWAAGLLLAGCSSEADMEKLMDWQSNPDAVHFTASVNNATTRTNPAATDDAQTKFNENDQVTVSNNGNQANYAYVGESWVPAIADKYLLWDRSNLTFNCWYPAGGNNTATVGYLTADQSSAEGIAKSDYMNAEKTLKSADEALNFSLERKTARLVLKISGFTDVPGNIKHVRIVSKASTAADETNKIDITPLTSGGGAVGTTYTALVAPGKVVAKFYFTDNTSTEEPVTMTTNVTEAGSSYIYNLNVIKRTKIEVTGITEGPWTASGTTTGDLTPIPYVTFKAEQAQTFKMTAQYYTISGLQYSVNNGDWNDVVADKVVEFGGDKGDLRLRGTNTNGTASADDPYSTITFTKDALVAAVEHVAVDGATLVFHCHLVVLRGYSALTGSNDLVLQSRFGSLHTLLSGVLLDPRLVVELILLLGTLLGRLHGVLEVAVGKVLLHQGGVAGYSREETAVELEAVESELGALHVAAYVGINACGEHLGNLHGSATCLKLLVVLCTYSLAQSFDECLHVGRVDAILLLHVVHESACGEHTGCIAQRVAGTQQARIGRLDYSCRYSLLLFLVLLDARSGGKRCSSKYGKCDDK